MKLGKFFGFQALKHQGKTFVILSGDQLVFRLDGERRKEALELAESSLWNPYGREKHNWVVLSSTHSEQWRIFFDKALQLVRNT